jgi:serine protease Do
MRDLPRFVAETPVGKVVEVVIVRRGKEESRTVRLGSLEDREKQAALTPQKDAAPEEQPSVQKMILGLNLSNMTNELRGRYKIKDSVKGVVIAGIDAQVPTDKRLNLGDVIVEVSQTHVANAGDVQKLVDQLKQEGRKSALLLVANAEGQQRFVALTLQ